MSLNSALLTLSEDQIANDFYGDKEIKRTFLHKNQMIDVLITLNEDGTIHGKPEHFKRNEKYIWAPLSLEASSRGNGHVYPFALHEQLRYLSKNLKFDKETKKNKYFDAYIFELSKWENQCRQPMLQAVLVYLRKRDICRDIVKAGIHYNEKTFVAFQLFAEGKILEPWEDEALVNSYIEYGLADLKKRSDGALCYLTGENYRCSSIFPRGFYGFDYKSKYLMQQDEAKVVYHGIFHSSTEAVGISRYANYLIYWAMNYFLRFCTVKIGDFRYGLVCINSELKLDINTPLFPQFQQDKEKTYTIADIYQSGKEAESKLTDQSTILYLSIGCTSETRLTLHKLQIFRGTDAKLLVRNLSRWYLDCSTIVGEDYYQEQTPFGKKRFVRYTKGLLLHDPPSLMQIIWAVNHKKDEAIREKNGHLTDAIIADQLINAMLFGNRLNDGFSKEVFNHMTTEGDLLRYDRFNKWRFGELCALLRLENRSNRLEVFKNRNTEQYYYGRLQGLLDELERFARKNVYAVRLGEINKQRPKSEVILANYKAVCNLIQNERFQDTMEKRCSRLLERIIKAEHKGSEADFLLGYQYELERTRRLWNDIRGNDRGSAGGKS